MYSIKAPLRSRIDPPLKKRQQTRSIIPKLNKLNRKESDERFSSFETPPPSD